MKKQLSILALLLVSLTISAAEITVRGVVRGKSDRLSIPGVSVVVKGTTEGTMTDIDGNYNLTVDSNGVLRVSCIGYSTREISVNGQSQINIELEDDTKAIDEIVVVGYGVQKKSVVTASIAKVTADDLSTVNPVRLDDALKGLAAGVTVTSNSGQPGAGSVIRVRGTGTINNAEPLYIVDGMPVEGGIGFLNPNDIASVEVLKDAASGAVYGARAANGVILVTTKTGSVGKTRVSYDYSYSVQNPWRKREVLNASEYAVMMNEGAINAGGNAIYSDPYSFGKGTNWQDEVFYKNAPQQNHQLSISGATEKVDYYFSAGYFQQDGIIGGNYDRSNYDRLSIRSNTNYKLFDESKSRNWLQKITVGVNTNYTNVQSRGIGTNSEFGSVLGSAVNLSPILGVYYADQAAEDAAYALYSGNAAFHPVVDKNGRLYTIPGKDYNELTNPIAQLALPGDMNWSDKLLSTLTAELSIWKSLSFRSSLGVELNWYGNDGWTPQYYLNDSGNQSANSRVWSSMNKSNYWKIDNTINWHEQYGKHDIAVVLGQSALKSSGRTVGGSNLHMIQQSGDKANIDATTGLQSDGTMAAWGGRWEPHALSSLFGRLSYNYDERYIFQATVRRDGSSNFGANNRYGTFPSFSLGWNLTNEAFMEKRPEWYNMTKFRLSWGKNGNENIGRFRYTTLTATGNNYVFGSGPAQGPINGVKPAGIANADLRWEESIQTNGGVDFGFLNNSLTFSMDYYVKKTDGMLIEMPIPGYVGEVRPIANVGMMENRGLELELGYKFRVNEWSFRASANATYLKNKLIDLGNESGFLIVESVHGMGEVVRAQNGMTFPYFFGYKSNGIFQNWDEIRAYVNKDGGLIQPNAVPGDVRWVDIDGDGSISNDDKTKIGQGTPDWTYGLNLGVSYKGWDFNVMCQGTIGNDVYDGSRRNDIASANLPRWMLNRWTGEGTSNSYPRFAHGDQNNWGVASDLYVSDASYFRVKNVQLGYTLPQKWTRIAFIDNLRLYVSADNLLTFTKYAGFDPEVASGSSLGVDRGVYPQARVFNFGVNLNF